MYSVRTNAKMQESADYFPQKIRGGKMGATRTILFALLMVVFVFSGAGLVKADTVGFDSGQSGEALLPDPGYNLSGSSSSSEMTNNGTIIYRNSNELAVGLNGNGTAEYDPVIYRDNGEIVVGGGSGQSGQNNNSSSNGSTGATPPVPPSSPYVARPNSFRSRIRFFYRLFFNRNLPGGSSSSAGSSSSSRVQQTFFTPPAASPYPSSSSQPVPEPATVMLLGLGAVFVRKLRRKTS